MEWSKKGKTAEQPLASVEALPTMRIPLFCACLLTRERPLCAGPALACTRPAPHCLDWAGAWRCARARVAPMLSIPEYAIGASREGLDGVARDFCRGT